MSKAIIAIRLRGQVNLDQKRKETLHRLHLTRVNHAILIDDRPEYIGMLDSVKDYVTWGEIDMETLAKLLAKRAYVVDPNREPKTKKPLLTDKYIATHTQYRGIKDLSEGIVKGQIKISNVPNLIPVFRLTPPSGGFQFSIKRPFKSRGELGNRGDAVNSLLLAMI